MKTRCAIRLATMPQLWKESKTIPAELLQWLHYMEKVNQQDSWSIPPKIRQALNRIINTRPGYEIKEYLELVDDLKHVKYTPKLTDAIQNVLYYAPSANEAKSYIKPLLRYGINMNDKKDVDLILAILSKSEIFGIGSLANIVVNELNKKQIAKKLSKLVDKLELKAIFDDYGTSQNSYKTENEALFVILLKRLLEKFIEIKV